MKPVPLSLFTTGIYGYLDFVLIGWTLGLVWLAVRALVTAKGSFAQKVRAGLSDEVFLFGGWGGDVRTAVGGWMFLLSVVLLQFDMFFMNSLVRELDLPWYGFLASWLNIAYSMLLILKIVLFTRYSGRQLVAAYCFFFVFRWVYLNNHQYWFAMVLFYMLAAKDAPLRRTLKAGLVTSCASFLAVAVASSAGWIGTLSELWDDGRMRNSFGYGWYNLTGVIVLALCLMYVCLRQVRNLKWFDFIVLAAALVFCNEGPASRAAVVCLALLIALTLLLRFFMACPDGRRTAGVGAGAGECGSRAGVGGQPAGQLAVHAGQRTAGEAERYLYGPPVPCKQSLFRNIPCNRRAGLVGCRLCCGQLLCQPVDLCGSGGEHPALGCHGSTSMATHEKGRRDRERLPRGDAGPRVHGEPRHLALCQCVPVADALRALPAAERAGGGFRA